jgi:hypothetical protein
VTHAPGPHAVTPKGPGDAIRGTYGNGGLPLMNSEERRKGRYERRKAERDRRRHEKLSKYDDFSLLTDPDNLYKAFLSARKGVSWKESTQRYEMNIFQNIIEARRRLMAGENVQSGFVEFTLHERGKIRHIKSVHISERVIQKVLCDQVLVPILSNGLIHDNGASIKGKGVHFAIRRLITHLSRFYRRNGFSNEGYCLTVDFSKFFDNIRHDILIGLIGEQIHDEKVLELTRRFITIFGDGISLGLGSQVSQISAIFFPTKLDHNIKEVQRMPFYGRYMDDLYLIHRSKEYLEQSLEKIKEVCDSLAITINLKKTKILPLKDGIIFLKGKYILLENGKIIRKATKDCAIRMRRKLKKFKLLLDAGRMNHEDIRIAYQSWRGNYIGRFNAYHTVKRMDGLYDSLFIYNRP